ncbi:MAG TPA: TetR/AcrR family transcriptional regulator [Myxococcota bacterium]
MDQAPELPRRKKQPEVLRQTLLDVAAAVAVRIGPGRITLDLVASEAGVSKGGLLHHFPSKQALLTALFEASIVSIDARIDAALAADDLVTAAAVDAVAKDAARVGRFTRAYLRAVVDAGAMDKTWDTLAALLTSEPTLSPLWAQWLDKRLIAHADTDCSTTLTVVRLAVDGLWLAATVPGLLDDRARAAAVAQLLKMATPSAT